MTAVPYVTQYFYAYSQTQQVTNIARQMVTRYGLSSLGPVALENVKNPGTRDRIDKEICGIVNMCEGISNRVVSDHRVIIDFAVERLLEVETLDGNEFRSIISQYTILPEKRV